MSKMVYSVNLWGSDPKFDNDDCWSGADFESLAEAEAAYANPEAEFTAPEFKRDLAGVNHDVYVELARGVRDGSMKMVDVETLKLRKVKGRKGSYLDDLSDDDEWRREQAHQAGMAFGCDGYNDVMGY